jgi:chemotaxis signal transduction protein
MATRSSVARRALPCDPFQETEDIRPAPLLRRRRGKEVLKKEAASQDILVSEPLVAMPAPGEPVPSTAASVSGANAGDATAPSADPSFHGGAETPDLEGLPELLGLPADLALEVGGEISRADDHEPEGREEPALDVLIAGIDEDIRRSFDQLSEGAEARAGALATPTEQHVIFSLAGNLYTAPIGNVMEIGHPPNVTSVPNVPPWLSGVTNLRGDIVSVVDLRGFLGMPTAAVGNPTRMLVVRTADEDLVLGFIVDSVRGIRHLESERIGEPAAAVDDHVAHYARGTILQDGDFYIVMDMEILLHSSALRQFEAAWAPFKGGSP